MKRDSVARDTSIKKLKLRARELRISRRVPLAQALEIAATEAGFPDYHTALKSLSPQPAASNDDQFEQARRALQAINAFVARGSQYDPMSKALAEIYFARPGARAAIPNPGLAEYALATLASKDQAATKVLSLWLATALTDTELDAPRFGVNVVLGLEAGAVEQRPRSCVIGNWATLAEHAKQSLRSLGISSPKIDLSPVALLAIQPEHRGTLLSDWFAVLHPACADAQQRLDGGPALNWSGGRPPDSGTGAGANYVLFGRATSRPTAAARLERALEEVQWDGVSVVALAHGGPVQLMPRQLAAADGLMWWLYAPQVDAVSEFLEDLSSEPRFTLQENHLRMVVTPGEMDSHVQIEAVLSDDDPGNGRTRTVTLGDVRFPCYLYAALRGAFGDVVAYKPQR